MNLMCVYVLVCASLCNVFYNNNKIYVNQIWATIVSIVHTGHVGDE